MVHAVPRAGPPPGRRLSWIALLAAALLAACGNGGDGPPDVTVLVGFFPPGLAPPGYHEAKAKVSRGRATIQVAGVTLDYDPVHDQYQGSIPDLEVVDVSVTAEAVKLEGEIIRRAQDATCTFRGPDVIHWGFESRAQWSWETNWHPGTAGIGLVDPSDIDGPLFWPVGPPDHLVEEQTFKRPESLGPPGGGYLAIIPPLQPPNHPVDHLWLVSEGIDGAGMLSGTASPVWGVANLCARSVPVNSAALVSLTIQGTLDYPFNRGVVGSLQAVGRFSDGTTADLSNMVTWTSSDDSILQVVHGDVIVGAVGSVQITATLNGLSASVPVVVGSVTLLKLDVTPTWTAATDRVLVPIGFQGQLQAVAYFSGGWQPDVTDQVTWRGGDPSAIAVDATGHVTAASGFVGSVTISATLDGVQGSIVIEATY